jgi:endonuclease/exonuclease/phosphatase family metal-dependent hydrolase
MPTNIFNHFMVHGWGILTYPFIPKLRGKTNVISEWRRISFIEKRRNLEPVLKLIAEINPDLLVLNEAIYELYKGTIETALRDQGFQSISWGAGNHYLGTHFSTVVATKKHGAPIACNLPQRRVLGGGAGTSGIRLEKEKLSIFGLHLSLGVPALWNRQVDTVVLAAEEERARGQEVILAGDWNESEPLITEHPGFKKLKLISADSMRTLTCPTFFHPAMKDLDHIFMPEAWQRKSINTFSFGSDHLALLAEVER